MLFADSFEIGNFIKILNTIKDKTYVERVDNSVYISNNKLYFLSLDKIVIFQLPFNISEGAYRFNKNSILELNQITVEENGKQKKKTRLKSPKYFIENIDNKLYVCIKNNKEEYKEELFLEKEEIEISDIVNYYLKDILFEIEIDIEVIKNVLNLDNLEYKSEVKDNNIDNKTIKNVDFIKLKNVLELFVKLYKKDKGKIKIIGYSNIVMVSYDNISILQIV